MSEKLSEKEQRLEKELAQARLQLKQARGNLESIEQAHSLLKKRQHTAQTLDRVCELLGELSQSEPLSESSPFDGQTLDDENKVNRYYAALVERIKDQVTTYRQRFSISDARLVRAKEALVEAGKQVSAIEKELEKSRPVIRTYTVTRVGSDGVERDFFVVHRRESLMPWSESARDERRYKKIFVRTMVAMLLLSIILPFVPVPEIERAPVVDVPDRVAQLVPEKPPPPPPPPPKIGKKKGPEPMKKKQVPRKKAPEAKTDIAKLAREKAKRSGFLAYQESLADLMDNSAEQKLGRQARITSGGEKARQTERSLLTTSASRGSGGLNTASLSRDVAGTGLSGRGTSRVTTTIGSDFGDAQRPLAESIRGSRTDEEIQLVFDRNKSALYSIYQRALRQNPTLKGKIVLKITIAPSGKVLNATVLSSDLGDKSLEFKIATRVKLFNFGAKDVAEITISYPIDFLPA